MPPLPTLKVRDRLWWEDLPGLQGLIVAIADEVYRFDLIAGVSVAAFKLTPAESLLFRVDNFLWWEETA